MNDAEHNPDGQSSKHPHEPEIPPILDAEGRCLVCCQSARIAELERELSRCRGPAINPSCPVCPSSTPDQVIFSPVYGGNRHFYCKSCEQSFAGSFTYGPSELEHRVEELTGKANAWDSVQARISAMPEYQESLAEYLKGGNQSAAVALNLFIDQLRATLAQVTRERDEARAEAKRDHEAICYAVKQLAGVDCGAAPIEALARRAAGAIAELAELKAQLAASESALNAAREAIENAPHTAKCDERNNRLGFVATDPPPSCTCWKSEALAQIDKALSPQQSKTT